MWRVMDARVACRVQKPRNPEHIQSNPMDPFIQRPAWEARPQDLEEAASVGADVDVQPARVRGIHRHLRAQQRRHRQHPA